MATVYAPGCALTDYKPHLAQRVLDYLQEHSGDMPLYDTCCRADCELPAGTQVLNTCPGCNRRFPTKKEGITTRSLWEVLAEAEDFPFPDYGGMTLAIHDACPTRTETKIHDAVRTLLRRMNIRVLEPAHTQQEQRCCGDSAYPEKSIPEIYTQMQSRAGEMPTPEVCVYCVSCVKALYTGGKTPRYLVDLLFGEPTDPTAGDDYSFYLKLWEYRDTL